MWCVYMCVCVSVGASFISLINKVFLVSLSVNAWEGFVYATVNAIIHLIISRVSMDQIHRVTQPYCHKCSRLRDRRTMRRELALCTRCLF
ncbi:hypothetical protein F4778DRAFT_712996 [Xylariomycetidae sp. FL2044]|nr:hypothetical protein F4778DRAFT_712996 [Xylariomycetidae sp. FL2044]